MDVDKDGVISYMDYKLSLSRNPMLLEMINPFSIHSILEDATSGNPHRVSRVSLECSKACSHHTVSSHQPRHRGSLIKQDDWANMMASKKTHVDPVTGNGGGVHAMKQSVSAKRIRPGKKRQGNIFLEKKRWRRNKQVFIVVFVNCYFVPLPYPTTYIHFHYIFRIMYRYFYYIEEQWRNIEYIHCILSFHFLSIKVNLRS